jgi:hypothetical protein
MAWFSSFCSPNVTDESVTVTVTVTVTRGLILPTSVIKIFLYFDQ